MRERGAKVIVLGDDAQLQSTPTGGWFRGLLARLPFAEHSQSQEHRRENPPQDMYDITPKAESGWWVGQQTDGRAGVDHASWRVTSLTRPGWEAGTGAVMVGGAAAGVAGAALEAAGEGRTQLEKEGGDDEARMRDVPRYFPRSFAITEPTSGD